jgi:hypothetical protein
MLFRLPMGQQVRRQALVPAIPERQRATGNAVTLKLMQATVADAVWSARQMDIVRKESVTARMGMQLHLMAGVSRVQHLLRQRPHQLRAREPAIPVLKEDRD